MLTADDQGTFSADNHAWLLAWKNGSVFQAGPSRAINWYDTRGTGLYASAGFRGLDGDAMNGNAVMYDAREGKILTLGGAPSYAHYPASRAAHIITVANPFDSVDIEVLDSMHSPRVYATA